MAETYKILGQVAPSDTSEQILYSTPSATQAIVTNITVVNRSGSAQTFDVNVYNSVPSGSITSPAVNNVYKGVSVAANTFAILEPGITLDAQNSIVVKGNSNLTFSASGVELS